MVLHKNALLGDAHSIHKEDLFVPHIHHIGNLSVALF